MQVNIIISAINRGNSKRINTTISYVNPTATNQQLISLAEALNRLTLNNYAMTTKETKEEL